MNNGLSFVRDFERLLGSAFFEKVKSFTPMHTDTEDHGSGDGAIPRKTRNPSAALISFFWAWARRPARRLISLISSPDPVQSVA